MRKIREQEKPESRNQSVSFLKHENMYSWILIYLFRKKHICGDPRQQLSHGQNAASKLETAQDLAKEAISRTISTSLSASFCLHHVIWNILLALYLTATPWVNQLHSYSRSYSATQLLPELISCTATLEAINYIAAPEAN